MTVIVIARLIEASLKNRAGENYPTNIRLNGSYNDVNNSDDNKVV
jgi:hypothetical protein